MKLRNCTAAFGWVLSAGFLGVCLAFTYILIRDGADRIPIYPPDIPGFYPAWFMPLVLAFFWLGGLAAAHHVWTIPCVGVDVRPDGSVLIVRRYPFRKETTRLSCRQMSQAVVKEITGGDGDPYYQVVLTDAGGAPAILAEGSDHAHCRDICRRVNIAAGVADDPTDHPG